MRSREAVNQARKKYEVRNSEKIRLKNQRLQERYRVDPTNKLKLQARSALNNALRSGRLRRNTTCEDTWKGGCSGRIEADHYLGYEKTHWFDVEWRCSSHHRRNNLGVRENKSRSFED